MIEQHAARGGAVGYDGKLYRGGEFLPFYVPRNRMPQVDVNDYNELAAWLEAQGVPVYQAVLPPQELQAHQRVDMKHVAELSAEALAIPVIISTDKFVLDGNHRWWANTMNGTIMRCMIVDLPFDAAIDKLLEFPKTRKVN